MKLGAKVKERIARTIGEYFSTNNIVNIFTDAKISTDKSLYAKWRIILDAFSKVTTEDGISHIIEDFCHPLNFQDLQIRQNFIDALNKILSYEDAVIQSTDRTAKMVSLSESKEKIKDEDEKVKVLPDINKSSYSEKVVDLVAKEFCEVLPNWEIKKVIKPIIKKDNELYNQEEIKGYFDEIDIGNYPFYTFSETLQAVRRKDKEADIRISAIITKLLHPLNYNADENQAEKIANKINKYLKYDRKVVDCFDKETGEYAVCRIANLEDEEYFRTEDEITLFEEEQEELQFLRLPENKEKISTLRKAYQTFINIVEVYCENPSKPSNEMNDAYLKTKELIADAVRDLRLYANNGDNKRIHTLEHYFIPFNNLFTAEREYTPDVMEIDLSGKKLSWDYIRPKMNATYGCINDLYYKIDGSDMPSKPDVQQIIDSASSLLSKIKKNNKKEKDTKQRASTTNPVQKIEITNMPELRVRNADDSAIVKNKKRIALPKFSSTSWSKVEIKFINEEVVYIKADKKTATVNYEGLGFNNDKTGKPNTAWHFLFELAKRGGETSEIKSPIPDSIKQHKKTISDRLKKIFKNDTDPFYDFLETNTYKIKIKLMPPIDEDQNDKLGIKEYLKETMTSEYEPEN
ncbi:MAG TPA: hypothetical protein DCX03_01720 [Bacteroidales bacterium]|nr:hypothetical protein [Bacteroidales bacterium]